MSGERRAPSDTQRTHPEVRPLDDAIWRQPMPASPRFVTTSTRLHPASVLAREPCWTA